MTELLYQTDAYLKEFMAHVTAAEGSAVALDRTACYATGGGQPHDTGTFSVGGHVWHTKATACWMPARRCAARSIGSAAISRAVDYTYNSGIVNSTNCAVLAQANSVLGLVHSTMFIERSRALTIPCNPSPSLPDASRTIAFSRWRSRPYGRRYIVGGLCTVCYLAARPPRVLLMGQQVLSCWYTQNSDRSDLTSHRGVKQKPSFSAVRTRLVLFCPTLFRYCWDPKRKK
jgi:hypothetical protein